MKRFAFRKTSNLGFALAFAIVFIAGIYIVANLNALIESNRLVSHTLTVLVTAQPPHFASYFVGLKSCLSSWKSAEADSAISPQGFHVLSRRLCEAPCGSAPRDQDG